MNVGTYAMKHTIHSPSTLNSSLVLLVYAAVAVVVIISLITVVLWAVGTF